MTDILDVVATFATTHQATTLSVMVAAANVILAMLTWSMARATRHMALETRDSVEVARIMANTSIQQVDLSREQFKLGQQTLLASILPMLLDAPEQTAAFDRKQDDWTGLSITHTRTHTHASLSFINVGVGVALVQSAHVWVGGRPAGHASSISERVLRPGETTRVSFVIPIDPHAGVQAKPKGELVIVVSYGDILGGNLMSSTASVKSGMKEKGHHGYVVAGLTLRGPDNLEITFGSDEARHNPWL